MEIVWHMKPKVFSKTENPPRCIVSPRPGYVACGRVPGRRRGRHVQYVGDQRDFVQTARNKTRAKRTARLRMYGLLRWWGQCAFSRDFKRAPVCGNAARECWRPHCALHGLELRRYETTSTEARWTRSRATPPSSGFACDSRRRPHDGLRGRRLNRLLQVQPNPTERLRLLYKL